MDPEMLRYIRDHRDTYTREAITQHLRASGHSQEAIDAAWWQTVEAPDDSAPNQLDAANAIDPVRFVTALAIYVVGLLVVTNLLNWLSLLFGAVFYFAAVVVGIIYPIARFKRDRSAAVGVLCGLAIVVILFFVAPGLCTVATDVSF